MAANFLLFVRLCHYVDSLFFPLCPFTTMSDVDDFFAEQHDVINMPDESLEDYVARMAVIMNRCAFVHILKHHSP